MVILIPAYQPDEKLIKLVENLKKECDYRIAIVDDGSGKNYSEIFKSVSNLGATVLTCEKNKGKGAALKKGFQYIDKLENVDGVFTTNKI